MKKEKCLYNPDCEFQLGDKDCFICKHWDKHIENMTDEEYDAEIERALDFEKEDTDINTDDKKQKILNALARGNRG